MARIARLLFPGDGDEDGSDRQTASLAGLAVALFLVVVGLFLIRELHAKCAIEDCIMSGRSHCDTIAAALR